MHATCSSAQNFLSLQIFPFKIRLGRSSHQEITCPLGQLCKVHCRIVRPFLTYINTCFRPHKPDLGITGNKGCHYLICASSIYQSQIDPLFLKIAKFNGSVLGGIKNGMCNLVKGHFFHFSACSTIHFPTSCKTACRKCSC